VLQLLRSKKEVADTVDPQQVPTPKADRSIPRQRRRRQGPLDPVAEKGRGENEVAQPVNPAANVAANAPANPVANTPANDQVNATGNIANNIANTQENVAPNPRHTAGASPPPIQVNRAEGSQRHRVRDEVEIARRANYDREHRVLDPLDANNPIHAADLRIMHDQTCLVRSRQQPYRQPLRYPCGSCPVRKPGSGQQFPSFLMASPEDQIPKRLQGSD
jgi:hypothetical protein